MANVFIDTETSGLYPIVHRVVCIGYMREGEEAAIVDRDERRMLQQFMGSLRPDDVVVGFNLDFDYGFLVLRCLKHGLDPLRLVSCERVDLLKPINSLLQGKRVSLQALADYFKIEHEKTSGKLIPELWEAGEHEAIKRHCLDDVRLTARLFDRLKPLLFEPATARQKGYMRSLGVEFGEGVTKAEASKLIEGAKGKG